ncbi:MAG: 4Fe-4S dicluster domain-containing protein [Planctomycetaceae bacterium]|nr:4Fe-4S dicluster domain-containing protein [Planctomycetaceae bacterium]
MSDEASPHNQSASSEATHSAAGTASGGTLAVLPSATGQQPACADGPITAGSGIDYGLFLDCVHCGLCTSACPTYLETGNENDSPRGRIYLMRSVVDGRLDLTESVSRHLDLCLDCRSCETACPSGVQYGRLIEPFRVDMQRIKAAESGKKSSWFQRLVLYGLFPYPRRLKWALLPARLMQWTGIDRLARATGLTKLLPRQLQRMQHLLPQLRQPAAQLPEVLPAKGTRRARVALFTGCVADAMFSQTGAATARVLQANGCEVVVPRTQACCGAIHYHSGAGDPALALARQNLESLLSDDIDAIIVNVAGCGSMLKDYGHMARELAPDDTAQIEQLEQFAAKVRDISEFLSELGPVAPTGSLPLKATYHDACHLCHAQQIRSQPRELLGLIPDLELVPLAESEVCCGAAGSYNLMEPEMSDRLAARKLQHIVDTGAEAVIMGNAGCSLQIQAALRDGNHPIPVLHPVDLLDLSYRGLPLSTITGK